MAEACAAARSGDKHQCPLLKCWPGQGCGFFWSGAFWARTYSRARLGCCSERMELGLAWGPGCSFLHDSVGNSLAVTPT